MSMSDLFGFAGQVTDSAGFPAPPGTEEHWSESCLYELKRLKTFTSNRLDHLEHVYETHSGRKVPSQQKAENKDVASVKATVEYLNSAFMVLQDKCTRELDELKQKSQELEQRTYELNHRLPATSFVQTIEEMKRKFASLSKRQENEELHIGSSIERLTNRMRILQDSMKCLQENVMNAHRVTPRDQPAVGKDVVRRLESMESQINSLEASVTNISKKSSISPRLGLGSQNVSQSSKELGERDISTREMLSLKNANTETRANVKLLAEAAAAMDLRINALEKTVSAATGKLEIPDFHLLSAGSIPHVRKDLQEFSIPASSRASLESLETFQNEHMQYDVPLSVSAGLMQGLQRLTTPRSLSRVRSRTVSVGSEASRSPSPSDVVATLSSNSQGSQRRPPAVPVVDMVRLHSAENLEDRSNWVTPVKTSSTQSQHVLQDALVSKPGEDHRGGSISTRAGELYRVDKGSRSVERPPGNHELRVVETPGRSETYVTPQPTFTKSHSVSIPPNESKATANAINSPKLSPDRISQASTTMTVKRSPGLAGLSTPRLGNLVQRTSPPLSPIEDHSVSRRAILIKPPSSNMGQRTGVSPQGSTLRSAASTRTMYTNRQV